MIWYINGHSPPSGNWLSHDPADCHLHLVLTPLTNWSLLPVTLAWVFLQKARTWNKWAHFNKETSLAGTYCASEHLVTATAADSRQGCFLALIVSRLFAELEAASHSEAEDRFLSWQILWEQPPSQVQPNNIAPGQFLRYSCPCDKGRCVHGAYLGVPRHSFLGLGPGATGWKMVSEGTMRS